MLLQQLQTREILNPSTGSLKGGNAITREAVGEETNYPDVGSPGFSKFLFTMSGLGISSM